MTHDGYTNMKVSISGEVGPDFGQQKRYYRSKYDARRRSYDENPMHTRRLHEPVIFHLVIPCDGHTKAVRRTYDIVMRVHPFEVSHEGVT